MTGRGQCRHAMTLVEVILAMAVLGIVLGSLTEAISLSVRTQRSTAERARGAVLAAELLESIAVLPYLDPDGTRAIGLDAGEAAADPSTFDDIDDFHTWTERVALDGTRTALTTAAVRADKSGWTRTVTVEWVTLGSPLAADIAETGVKKITVRVEYNGRAVATLDRLRIQGADAALIGS